MLRFQPDSYFFPYRMIMMAWNERQGGTAAGQLQGIQDIGAPECFLHNLGLYGAGIVMHDIVRTDQHIHHISLLA